MSERPFFVRSARCAINFLPCLLYNFICWHFLWMPLSISASHSLGLCLDLIFGIFRFAICDLPLGFGVCVRVCVCESENRKCNWRACCCGRGFCFISFLISKHFCGSPRMNPLPPRRLYGSKLAALAGSKWESSSALATISLCFRWFLLFHSELRPELFHFRLCNEFNSQLYLFFLAAPQLGPKIQFVSSTTWNSKPNWNLSGKVLPWDKDCSHSIWPLSLWVSGSWIYANICQPQSRPQNVAMPPVDLAHNFHSDAKSKQDNLLC